MRLQLVDISGAEFDTMHQACLRLLNEFGVLFENREARELLEKAGNPIDSEGRAHLRPKFVESILRQVPRDGFTLYGRDEAKRLRVAVDEMSFRPSTGEPFVLDYPSRERREATADDAVALVRVTDALDGFQMVNAVVNVRDAPGTWENINLFLIGHRHSLKPSDVTVSSVREVRAVARISAALRGGERELRQKPLTAVDISMMTPLRCSPEETAAFMEAARLGIPIEILSSPSMGVSAPITLAGSVVASMAEVLAAACLIYLVNPGLGIINTARISPVSMRTGSYNYGAPELGMGSVVMAALSARYHIPTNLYGFGSAAKVPGAQSGMEKAFGGLLMGLGRHHMITGSGVVDNSLVTSPELIVIDHEAIRFLHRIRMPIAIDDEAIGIDTLMRGMREDGTLLSQEHTLRHLKAGEMLDAGLDQWSSRDSWERAGKPDLLDTAHQRVVEILQQQRVPPFEPAVEREIERARAAFSA